MSPLSTFVVVGANLAGGLAAAELRREGFDGRVVLVGEESHPPYDRPPLSREYLRGEQPFEEALLESPEFYAEQEIEVRFGRRATRLDPQEKIMGRDDGETLGYDRVLLATGGATAVSRYRRSISRKSAQVSIGAADLRVTAGVRSKR